MNTLCNISQNSQVLNLKKVVYYDWKNQRPWFEDSPLGDMWSKGQFAKHGINTKFNHLQPMAEPGTPDYYKQLTLILQFQDCSDKYIQERINQIKKRFSDLEEMESREQKRRVINSHCNTDVSALKKQLRTYLIRKNIPIIDKGGVPLVQCPGHEDRSPSGCLYEKQDKPVVYCPVCGVSYDIFNIAGLLIGSSDFKMQLSDVRRTLGVD